MKYTGPTSLKAIEERLLEIEHEKPMRIHNSKENYSGSIEDEIEAADIDYLDVEKAQLQLKRQFILDNRSSWLAKSIWNVIVPIVVSIITTYIISVLITAERITEQTSPLPETPAGLSP